MYFYAIIFVILVLIIINAVVKRNPVAKDKIAHKVAFDKQLYDPGEEIILTTEIENKSNVTMRKVYVKNTVDSAFNVCDEDDYTISKTRDSKKQLAYRTDVSKKSVREIKTRFFIDRRGVYYSYAINVDYVDFLGLHTSYYEKDDKQKVIVAPKRVSNKFLDKLVAQGYGDRNAKSGFINDETSIRSYGEYTGHEPMRHINWKKTAQTDDFMVKQFEPMGTNITTIVFDLTGYSAGSANGKTGEWVEYAISMLRVMFEYFEDKRIPYRLFTNAKSSHIKANQFISTASGKKSRIEMLEMLGELDVVMRNRDTGFGASELLNYAIKSTEKAPIVYLAPRKRNSLTHKINKVIKLKGIEIMELYANDYYKPPKKEE